MTDLDNKCPLCETTCRPIVASPVTNHNLYEYPCTTCGTFYMDRIELEMLGQTFRSDQRKRHQLSALLKERELKGMAPVLLHAQEKEVVIAELSSIRIQDLLATWPESVPEQLDRALLNLSRLGPDIGHMIETKHSQWSVVMALSDREVLGILSALTEDGSIKGSMTQAGFSGRITSQGWRRVEELSKRRDPSKDPVFVAMAFTPAMVAVYDSAIAPAIREAGYKVNRVDKVEHNDYIMDKILAMLRVAPFVVADFTEHRNGVYFEAGFAKGLGIPVVSCCRQDEFEKAHFDTKQLNHVLWNTPKELRERLRNRILGSIGRGPLGQTTE
jgi:nucleoside 2-deoxyribosyltransferase